MQGKALFWIGFKNHNCNPFQSSSLYILDFSNICYVIYNFFHLLKFDCSFRILNFDKFCDTAPLELSTTCFRDGPLELVK